MKTSPLLLALALVLMGCTQRTENQAQAARVDGAYLGVDAPGVLRIRSAGGKLYEVRDGVHSFTAPLEGDAIVSPERGKVIDRLVFFERGRARFEVWRGYDARQLPSTNIPVEYRRAGPHKPEPATPTRIAVVGGSALRLAGSMLRPLVALLPTIRSTLPKEVRVAKAA